MFRLRVSGFRTFRKNASPYNLKNSRSYLEPLKINATLSFKTSRFDAAQIGSFPPTFRDNLSAPTSRVKKSKKNSVQFNRYLFTSGLNCTNANNNNVTRTNHQGYTTHKELFEILPSCSKFSENKSWERYSQVLRRHYAGVMLSFTTKGHRGPGSSVGIATACGLDGPGIESLWGAKFSALVQTGPEAHPASCTRGQGAAGA
jgi:hypothetical protein